MFDWLFEGRTSVYVMLVALAVFLLLVWWQTRKRGFLVGVAVVAALIGVYALLNKTVETDREQIVRTVNAMIAAVNAGDVEGIFQHVSDDFRSPGARDKSALREMARRYLDQKIVTKVDVWDIACIGEPSREQRAARARFSVKVHGQPGVDGFLADCDAMFDYDSQQGWRLRSLRLLKPQTTEEWQIQL